MSKDPRQKEYYRTEQEAIDRKEDLLLNPLVTSRVQIWKKRLPPFMGWWVVAYRSNDPNFV